MSITEGDISANFRFNNRTGLLVPETITDERQIVAALPEFSGDYGFTLNETPQTDIAGITQVMRVSDSQIFTHTNLATVGLTEYFFDYSNDMPTLFFNAANNGEEFSIQYFGVGGAVNGKNIFELVDDGMAAVIAPIEAQITAIENDIVDTNTRISDIAGLIIGGTDHNALGLPPIIKSGAYDISGVKVKLTSDSSLALTDVMQQGRQIIEDAQHYLVCMNSTGDKKYILYGEGAVSNGTITSITSVGTTYTLTVATGTVGAHTDKVLVIEGNDNINGTFKITGGNGTTTYTFTTQSGFTNGGASGTWRVLERIMTKHGNSTGALTAITSSALMQIFSASLGENGADSIAAFDTSKNGFYLTLDGLTDYRVLGSFFEQSINSVKENFSYKSGRNKNDNFFQLASIDTKVTSAIRFFYQSTYCYYHGCDYIFFDSAGAGTELIAQRDMISTSSMAAQSTSGSFTIILKIADTSSNVLTDGLRSVKTVALINTISSAVMVPTKINKGQILKPLVSTSVNNNTDGIFKGSFQID